MDLEKKNTNKTVLIVVGVVAGLCLLACIIGAFTFGKMFNQVAESLQMEPAQIATAAHEISDYDLPPGYVEQVGMDLGAYTFVMIGPQDYGASMMIMLAQFQNSSGLSDEEMAEQMRRSFEQQSGQPGMQMRVVETRPVVIRGAETEAVVREGTSNTGTIFRQLVAVFPGKDGQAVLLIQGSDDDWDDDLIDGFIRSMR
jgi:hypothetical protein